MASGKDIYEAKIYAANIYAAGVFRGVGPAPATKFPGNADISRSGLGGSGVTGIGLGGSGVSLTSGMIGGATVSPRGS